MQESNIITISTNHPCYPEAFHHVNPKINEFYAIGDLSLLIQAPRLSIVSTRYPSHYGTDVTQSLAGAASRAGATIVSGLARGVDSLAHKAAVQYGQPTIAVLPASIKQIYPLAHTKLANDIIKSGGLLISEYYDSHPNKYCFIRRNRLIAALANVLLVTEAASTSGSRHTVEFAQDMGITIALTPGPITNPLSALPNSKIKDGGYPITTNDDLFALLNINGKLIGRGKTIQGDTPEEQLIINSLTQDQTTDSLLQQSKLDPQAFNIHITMLEIKGIIVRTSGNTWRLAK